MSSPVVPSTVLVLTPRLRREAGTEPGLVPYLLQAPGHPESIDDEFLREAVLRFSENEDLGAVFVDAMVNISSTLAKLSMEVDFKIFIDVGCSLLRCRIAPNAEHDAFVNAPSAPTIETNTILGPFFRLSPLKSETVSVLFGSPRGMDKGSIARSQDSMRHQLSVHQNDLFAITNAFVRASLRTRGRVLDWFANIMNMNHKRRALQVVAKEVASDAFMLNVTRVLDRLCEPFMDTSFSKMDRINADYFRQKPRLDIGDETKLNADQAASDAFYESPAPGNPHFISEIFFLTLASHHYGLEGVVSRLKTLEREIKFYEKNIAVLEDERRKFLNVRRRE
jgi:ubiquitin conjugation factor E4 B